MQMRNKKEQIENMRGCSRINDQNASPKKFTYLKKGQNTRKYSLSPNDSKRVKVAKPPQKSLEVLKKQNEIMKLLG